MYPIYVFLIYEENTNLRLSLINIGGDLDCHRSAVYLHIIWNLDDDEDDFFLYVGQSRDLAKRLSDHMNLSDIGCQWWQLQLYSELDSAIHGFSATHSSQLYMGLSWTGIWIQLYKEYVLFLSFLKSIYTVYTAL